MRILIGYDGTETSSISNDTRKHTLHVRSSYRSTFSKTLHKKILHTPISGCNYTHKYLVVPAYTIVWLHLHTQISGFTDIHYCLVEATYQSILLYQRTPKCDRTYYTSQGLVLPRYTNFWFYLHTPLYGLT